MQTTPKPKNDDGTSSNTSPTSSRNTPRPIIFLDIDGVLNTVLHNAQIHLEPTFVERLKAILETTNAMIVYTTFWRHFHEYITYVLHRHGINVANHVLPLPMGVTRGKQSTKKFLHYQRIKQKENGYMQQNNGDVEEGTSTNSMIGRSAEDEGEYASRAEEIEDWLQTYGLQYLGSSSGSETNNTTTSDNGELNEEGYDWHPAEWRYVILDDRQSAAEAGTPLFDRFVFTKSNKGLTEEDAEKAIRLLLHGPS